jgi:hypothetical protein
MSHVLELTEEQYSPIAAAAAKTGQTPEQLVARMASALTQAEGTVYYDLDEFFRALGMTEAEIAESERIFNEREQADAGQAKGQLEAVEDADVWGLRASFPTMSKTSRQASALPSLRQSNSWSRT